VILGELMDLNFPLVMIIVLEYIKLWKQILQCSNFKQSFLDVHNLFSISKDIFLKFWCILMEYTGYCDRISGKI